MKDVLKPVVAATALAITAFAGTATALPLDQLYFSQSAGVVNPLTDGDPVTGFFNTNGTLNANAVDPNCGNTNLPGGTSAGLDWRGSSSGGSPSSICINSFDTASSHANFGLINQGIDDVWDRGEFWVITQNIQENNELSGGPWPNPLWIADTLSNFFVYTDAAQTDVLIDDSGSTNRVSFWETSNVSNWANCTPTDPYASLDPNQVGDAGPCADRYRVGTDDFAPIESAPLDGWIYSISFTVVPGAVRDANGELQTLTIVDAGPDFIDVYTPEIAPGFSNIFVVASWDRRQVPVPSVLALFGAGLLGLGLANRRRKQRS